MSTTLVIAGIVSGIACLIFGQATEGDVGVWSSVTGCGILGTICVFLLTKHIPKLHKQYTDAIAAKDAAFLNQLKQNADRFDGWNDRHHEQTKQLIDTLTEMRLVCQETRHTVLDAVTCKGNKSESRT